MNLSAHDVASFLVGFTFGYVSTTLLMAALTAFLAWWIAALITACITLGVVYTDTFQRHAGTAATHLVTGARTAASWLSAKFGAKAAPASAPTPEQVARAQAIADAEAYVAKQAGRA